MNVRAASSLVLYDVLHHGHSLSDTLPDYLKKFSDTRDQALIQAICYGVCRWYYKLDAIANTLLDKPLKNKDQDVHLLILVGLFQLIEMRIPEHAAVSETVDATKSLQKVWAKNLVNGVLRTYLRNATNISTDKTPEEKYAHPNWLIGKIKKSWPSDWESVLEANNEHPPFSLRVNQQKSTRDEYLKKLTDAVIISETHAGIILEKAINVNELPGFQEGFVSVQDGAAQLAAELLQLAPNLRVLDACAAPGGKASHILEKEPSAHLVAIDEDDARLNAVRDNFKRLDLSAKILCADVGDLDSWWDGVKFDRVLLDAPCSATGVIRRHPDIKFLRRFEDIKRLVAEQKRLLNALWNVLETGGILLYATCSIFPEENFLVLKSFLDEHADAVQEKINATWGKECEIGRQILPGSARMDGFYYGCLKKL